MDINDRRCDQASSEIIDEALKIQRAFDRNVAVILLRNRGMKDQLTLPILAGRYDRRTAFRRETVRKKIL